MRSTTIVLAALVLAIIVGCASKKPEDKTSQSKNIQTTGLQSEEPGRLVEEEGHAPYYTTLASAQEAAIAGQPIAVEYYTDW